MNSKEAHYRLTPCLLENLLSLKVLSVMYLEQVESDTGTVDYWRPVDLLDSQLISIRCQKCPTSPTRVEMRFDPGDGILGYDIM